MEPSRNTPDFDEKVKKNILNKLISAELFENFIHTKFIAELWYTFLENPNFYQHKTQ
jgi:hypothetical protein